MRRQLYGQISAPEIAAGKMTKEPPCFRQGGLCCFLFFHFMQFDFYFVIENVQEIILQKI